MTDERLHTVAATGLVIGALLGMAGAFAPSATPTIAAGTALSSASLALVSASPIIPRLTRMTGAIASVLFAVTALRIVGGAALTPLSAPLRFYGFPFLAATLLGWAWMHRRAVHPDATPTVNKRTRTLAL